MWTGVLGLRIWLDGLVEGSSRDGNEPSGSMTEGEFLNELSDYKLLRKNSVACN
jgi:hypothetical protein